jgi:hypothetical protein
MSTLQQQQLVYLKAVSNDVTFPVTVLSNKMPFQRGCFQIMSALQQHQLV